MSEVMTEYRNENTKDIDILPTIEMVKKMNEEDKIVALAVEDECEHIAQAIDIIAKQFLKGGKLYYFGAGTSGRLGILDASECPPTFSVSPDMVQGIMAGGDKAFRIAVEGAEDDFEAGKKDAEVLTDKDVEEFEKESGSKVFYNLPCLDDKLDNQPIINAFLSALGFSRVDNETGGAGLFSIFK